MDDKKDQELWRIAQKRAQFRRSAYSYIIINLFLWVIWWFTGGKNTGFTGYPWPIWVMLGWGISLVMQYIQAYHGNEADMAEREYEKLKNKGQL